jgi:hypothetical protein
VVGADLLGLNLDVVYDEHDIAYLILLSCSPPIAFSLNYIKYLHLGACADKIRKMSILPSSTSVKVCIPPLN